jgi:hypothetical protein
MKSAWGAIGNGMAGVLRVAVATVAISAMAGVAAAQSGSRAVRLSDVDGQVELSLDNQVLASPAPVNTPMFEGTRVTTAEDGRAEIQFEDGSVARLSPNSSLTLTVLREQGSAAETQLDLTSGLAYFELQGNPSAGHFAVRFSGNTVSASGFTVVRIDLDNPPGTLAVFSGNAHLDNANALTLDLHGGESARLNASDPGNYVLSESIESDSWDAWNSDRDQQLTAQEAQRTQATTNVPQPANPAWSDLDTNGNWYNVPGQGYVWSPYAAGMAGWEPYGCGNWVWTPFNYAWASCEPWGYMPYASGMWGYYDGIGWGWSPGGSGGWWWYNGVWAPNVGTTAFRYTTPHRPHGGPIPPQHGDAVHSAPVIAVNRFHGSTPTTPLRTRNAPVTVAGTTVQPLKPIAVRPVYGHEPSVGGSYRGTAVVQSTAIPARGWTQIQTNSGAIARPIYTPAPASGMAGANGARMNGVQAGRPAAPPSGFVMPAQPSSGHPTYGGSAPSAHPSSGGSSGAGRPSGGPSGGGSAPSFSGGAMHGAGGGAGGGAPHGGSSGGGSSHH